MRRHLFICLLSLALVIAFHVVSFADAMPPTTPLDGSSVVVSTLFLCGLMGLIGQGCRVVVGLTTLGLWNVNAPAGQQDVFNFYRLVFSLFVGFFAGILTAFVQWKSATNLVIDTSDFNSMFQFAIAGYIGTDVVEAFTTKFFDSGQAGSQKPNPVAQSILPVATSMPPASLPPQATTLTDTLMDVHAMTSVIADYAGDATSPIGQFKQKSPPYMAKLITSYELKDFQAAGVFGNIGVECNGFTQLQEINPIVPPGGYGWAQWTGARRSQYISWCETSQMAKDSDSANFGFLCVELSGSFKSVIVDLKKTQTIQDATIVVLKEYEKAGVAATSRRISWAQIALAAYTSSQYNVG